MGQGSLGQREGIGIGDQGDGDWEDGDQRDGDRGDGDREDGDQLADVVGQWNSGRETCIVHLPKNPNQFFVLAT